MIYAIVVGLCVVLGGEVKCVEGALPFEFPTEQACAEVAKEYSERLNEKPATVIGDAKCIPQRKG